MKRNTADYEDGQEREHTVRFTTSSGRTTYAAVAGQRCSDPLDCVALTEQEARTLSEDRGRHWHLDDRSAEVVPLPEGWSNDGRPVVEENEVPAPSPFR